MLYNIIMSDFPFDTFRGIQNGDDATLDDVNVQQITFPDGSTQTAAAGAGSVVTDLEYAGTTLTLKQSGGVDKTATINTSSGTIYGFANITAEDTINVQSGNPTNANPNLKGGKLTDLTVSVTTTSTDQDVLLNTVITGEWGMPLSPWRKGIIIERLANGVSTLLRGVLATGHTNNGLILSPFSINTWFGDADSTQENATASYVDSPNYAGVIQYTPILVNTDSGTVAFHINTTVGTGFGLEDAFSVSTMRAVVVNE